jgi:hypothetical protein
VLRPEQMKTTHQFVVDDEYIAKAQHLSIAQNKTLRLLYQSQWIKWGPRCVFLAGAVVAPFFAGLEFLTVFFMFMLGLSFVGEMQGRRSLARARKSVRSKGSVSTYTLDEQGMDVSGAFGTSHLKWEAMLQPAVYPDGVLIKFSRVGMSWLPDSALIEGSPGDVRQLLAAHVKASTDRAVTSP